MYKSNLDVKREKKSDYDLPLGLFLKKLGRDLMRYASLGVILILVLVLLSSFTSATSLYCYQESANTSNQTGIDTQNCGLNYNGNYLVKNDSTTGYFYVNYTKPYNSLNSSLIQIKFGSIKNITIPNDCWIYSAQNISFRFNSITTDPTGSRASIYCYNGSWKELYNESNGYYYASSSANIKSYSAIFDGNWNNGSAFNYYNAAPNNWVDGAILQIYEEAMNWNLTYDANISIKAYQKFTNNELTGTFKINGTTVNPIINYLTLGTYNFSFTNTSYKQQDYVFNLTSYADQQINITNVSNNNFSVVVADNDSKANITGVTLSINYGSITENITSTTNPTTFNLTQNLTYTLTASKNGYITSTQNITPANTSQSITINLTPSNKVYITILDELTSNIIKQLIYVYFENDDNLFNYSTTTGYLNATNISNGTYNIRFVTANGNYTTTTYQATINSLSSPSITARLLQNTSGVSIGIYTKTITYQIIPNVLVTMQKQYTGGSYATVEQITTDVNGFGVLHPQDNSAYKIILTASGYATKEFTTTFYSANSPYTWLITQTSDNPYIPYLDVLQYYYTPTNTSIPQALNTFSITVYNATQDIAWVAVKINGSTTNVTGSSGGATASNNLDLTNYIGTINVVYYFNYYDQNTQDYTTVFIPVTYYVGNYTYYPGNIMDSLTDFKDDITTDTNITGGIWLAILAVFITIVAIITVMQLSGSQIAATMAGLSFSIFFAITGWLSIPMVAAQVIIIAMILFMQR